MDYRLKNIYEQMILKGEEVTEHKTYYNIGDIYQNIVLEAKVLSYKEFAKPETAKRQERRKLFLDKYKSKKPFRVFKNNSEKDVVFTVDQNVVDQMEALHVGDPNTNSPAYKQAKMTYDSIVLVNSKDPKDVYSLNNLVKTQEFSGQGSGAGAANTKLNESSVCVWAAVYQQVGKASIEDVINNAAKVQKYFKVDEDLNTILSQTDESWLASYESTVKYISEHVLNEENYSFHRGSSIVQKLYTKFAAVNKSLTQPFANANKWNPADIWALSAELKESELANKIESVKDMDGLNKLLRILYKNKQFIGISLKKTVGEVHSTEYNTSVKKLQAEFVSHDPGLGTKGIFSKDVYITGSYTYISNTSEEYKIQFRTFDPWSTFQGEIKSKHANFGKVAYGILNRILRSCNVDEIPNAEKVRDVAVDSTQNASLLKQIHSMYVSLGGNLTPETESVKDFIKLAQTSKKISEDYVYSKYLGLKLLTILDEAKEEVRNKVMTEIISYALSSSEYSGPFVKIY